MIIVAFYVHSSDTESLSYVFYTQISDVITHE